MSKPTSQQIDDAVVWVLSHILNRSPEEIRADENRYAAFHWDDGLIDFDDPVASIHWDTGETGKDGADNGYWMWERGDFDPKRSLVVDTETTSSFMIDRTAKTLPTAEHGYLYMSQVTELLSQDRIKLESPMVFGRIQSDDSLVGAAKALFRMDRDVKEIDDEFYEIDEEWQEMLDKIEHPDLRHHLGVFFQEAGTARCFGACFGSDFVLSGLEHLYEDVASWWIGEGQGECGIVRILDDTVHDVPAFDGHEFLEFVPKEKGPQQQPAKSAEELAVDSIDAHFLEHEEFWKSSSSIRSFVEAIDGNDPTSVIRGIQVTEPYCESILQLLLQIMKREEAYRFSYPIWELFAGSMTPQFSHFARFQCGYALMMLHAFDDAEKTFGELLELCEEYPADHLIGWTHNNYAICARKVGKLEAALEHAEKAVGYRPDNPLVHATLGIILFDTGEEEAGLDKIEIAMKEGINVQPDRNIADHPRYREMALEYRIPVRLQWDEDE